MKIWITWENQRRNRSTSKELGFKLYEVICDSNRFLRYPISIYKTFQIIAKERPVVVAVQNPSLILVTTSLIYRKLFGFILVVDSHNAGIKPFEGKKWWANLLAKLAIRGADLTIVTNDLLADYVKKIGGKAAILPDPIPDLACEKSIQKSRNEQSIDVVCISSWADDEPYLEVIKAASILPPNIRIHLTGKSRDKEKKYSGDFPGNIILTGFLSDKDYITLLCNADLTMVLTTRDDCMVCGAYESIAVCKPLILSDTPVLRSYFGDHAYYTDNYANAIADKIMYVIQTADLKHQDNCKSKEELKIKWLQMKQQLDAELLAEMKHTN